MGLESVELVMAWERSFAISIPNDRAATLVTPKLAAIAIAEILEATGRATPEEEIARVIKITTLEISGMPENKYQMDGHFVRDFGLD